MNPFDKVPTTAWSRGRLVRPLEPASLGQPILEGSAGNPSTANDLDLPTGQRGQKEFENASALCAMRGFALRPAEGFILARHGDQRQFPDLEAVLAFLQTTQEFE